MNPITSIDKSGLQSYRNKWFGLSLVCTLFIVLWWYIEAQDFAESKVSGHYVIKHDGITQYLTLERDHTFEQKAEVGGQTIRTNGTWRVFSSTGHVAFSQSFMNAPTGSRGQDEHEVYGLFKNYFGIVCLSFNSSTTSITAYKKLFN